MTPGLDDGRVNFAKLVSAGGFSFHQFHLLVRVSGTERANAGIVLQLPRKETDFQVPKK